MLAKQVAEWLKGLGGQPKNGVTFENVVPIEVTIGGETFSGAAYDWVEQGKADRVFYLVGDLPKCYQKSSHVCFKHNGGEWYVAGFYNIRYLKKVKQYREEQAKEQPFGEFFQLRCWSLDEKIDAHERKPYRRVEMSVTEK